MKEGFSGGFTASVLEIYDLEFSKGLGLRIPVNLFVTAWSVTPCVDLSEKCIQRLPSALAPNIVGFDVPVPTGANDTGIRTRQRTYDLLEGSGFLFVGAEFEQEVWKVPKHLPRNNCLKGFGKLRVSQPHLEKDMFVTEVLVTGLLEIDCDPNSETFGSVRTVEHLGHQKRLPYNCPDSYQFVQLELVR